MIALPLMRIAISLLVVGGLLVAATLGLSLGGVAAQPPPNVAALYTSLCANCHGPTMQGGQGPSLVDAEWKHGDSDADITRVIRDGVPTTPMAGACPDERVPAPHGCE